MALDVYFKQDILHALNAAYVAHEAPVALMRGAESGAPHDLVAHRAGFVAALVVVGLAFGLEPGSRDEPFPLRLPGGLTR